MNPHIILVETGNGGIGMRVIGLDHVSIIVSDADRALAFYQGILGLEPVLRPDLGFPGYWLDLGGGQTVHLMELPNPCEGVARPKHGGRDFHFALRVDDVTAWAHRLEQAGVLFTRSQSGRLALFLRDPDGNAVELFEVKKDKENRLDAD